MHERHLRVPLWRVVRVVDPHAHLASKSSLAFSHTPSLLLTIPLFWIIVARIQ